MPFYFKKLKANSTDEYEYVAIDLANFSSNYTPENSSADFVGVSSKVLNADPDSGYRVGNANNYTTIYATLRSSDTGDSGDSGSTEDNTGDPSAGCVFPGSLLYLDENTTIDIVDFEGQNPIDFCNPDTLEHSIQQTLTKCYLRGVTDKISLTLEDNKTMSLTANHAVLTLEGFKTFSHTNMGFPLYSVGDKLATVDGYKELIDIKRETVTATTVYNIITENSLMTINGIIVAGELEESVQTMAAVNNRPGFDKNPSVKDTL